MEVHSSLWTGEGLEGLTLSDLSHMRPPRSPLQRSWDLLHSHLTQDQQRDLLDNACIRIKSKLCAGAKWRIAVPRPLLEDAYNEEIARSYVQPMICWGLGRRDDYHILCLYMHRRMEIPYWDQVLGFKVLMERDEEHLFRTLNWVVLNQSYVES